MYWSLVCTGVCGLGGKEASANVVMTAISGSLVLAGIPHMRDCQVEAAYTAEGIAGSSSAGGSPPLTVTVGVYNNGRYYCAIPEWPCGWPPRRTPSTLLDELATPPRRSSSTRYGHVANLSAGTPLPTPWRKWPGSLNPRQRQRSRQIRPQ